MHDTLTQQAGRRDPRLLFLRSFLARPGEVGSIIPSSRFLERRIVRCAGVSRARLVVELGPGTGGTTDALLRSMPSESRLVALEINPRLARLVRARVQDPRLAVHQCSAADLGDILEREGLGAPDVVLSGIPFSTMERAGAISILRGIHDVLRPGGRFVAYQVRDRVEVLGREVFGPAQVQTELRNLPPVRVFRFAKRQD